MRAGRFDVIELGQRNDTLRCFGSIVVLLVRHDLNTVVI